VPRKLELKGSRRMISAVPAPGYAIPLEANWNKSNSCSDIARSRRPSVILDLVRDLCMPSTTGWESSPSVACPQRSFLKGDFTGTAQDHFRIAGHSSLARDIEVNLPLAADRKAAESRRRARSAGRFVRKRRADHAAPGKRLFIQRPGRYADRS
jgi:hypothetical protein